MECYTITSSPPFFWLVLPWYMGFPDALVVKNPPCQCRRWRCRFNPWLGKILLSRKWQLSPVLSGEVHGQRILAGYSPWGFKQLDRTEHTHTTMVCMYICICVYICVCVYIYIYIFIFFLSLLLDYRGFPHGSDGKESACNAGGPGLILCLGRSPGEGNGYPL